jgi:hypothetical protein
MMQQQQQQQQQQQHNAPAAAQLLSLDLQPHLQQDGMLVGKDTPSEVAKLLSHTGSEHKPPGAPIIF